MKKIYHLSTCKTCQKVLKELDGGKGFELQDLKVKNVSPEELDKMAARMGSYEALFSRRSRKYQAWSLKDKSLSEDEMRDLILKEYTFLKRPVIVLDEQVFAGSSKKNIEAVKAKI